MARSSGVPCIRLAFGHRQASTLRPVRHNYTGVEEARPRMRRQANREGAFGIETGLRHCMPGHFASYNIYGNSRRRSRCKTDGKETVCSCFCENPGSNECNEVVHPGYNLYKLASHRDATVAKCVKSGGASDVCGVVYSLAVGSVNKPHRQYMAWPPPPYSKRRLAPVSPSVCQLSRILRNNQARVSVHSERVRNAYQFIRN